MPPKNSSPRKDATTSNNSTPSSRADPLLNTEEDRQQAIYQEFQYHVQTLGFSEGVKSFDPKRFFRIPANIVHAIQYGYWRSQLPECRYPWFLWEFDYEFLETLYDEEWQPPSTAPARLTTDELAEYNLSLTSFRSSPPHLQNRWRDLCIGYVNLSEYREHLGCQAPDGPPWPAKTIREAQRQEARRASLKEKAEKNRVERVKDDLAQPASHRPGLPKRRGEDGDGDGGGSGYGGGLGADSSRPILIE